MIATRDFAVIFSYIRYFEQTLYICEYIAGRMHFASESRFTPVCALLHSIGCSVPHLVAYPSPTYIVYSKSVSTNDNNPSFYCSVALLCRMAESSASTAAVPSELVLFILLPGSSIFQMARVSQAEFVGDVIDAIIVKFKLNAPPQQLRLFKVGDDGSCGTSLLPTQTLKEAGLLAKGPIKLVVELQAAAHAPTSSTTGKCPPPTHNIVFPSVARSLLTWSRCFGVDHD
jgi:hypothetical protein